MGYLLRLSRGSNHTANASTEPRAMYLVSAETAIKVMPLSGLAMISAPNTTRGSQTRRSNHSLLPPSPPPALPLPVARSTSAKPPATARITRYYAAANSLKYWNCCDGGVEVVRV